MAKGRIVALVIIGIMLLTAVMPQLAVADALDQPINDSPLNGLTEIGPTQTFAVQPFVDTGDNDTAIATQWQWRTSGGSYTLPLYDTGIVYDSSAEAAYPEGVFDYGQTYYWHMRVQNNHGQWSAWSAETSFTVITNSPPSQPENFEPDANATGVSLPLSLQACEFRDPNASEVVLGEPDKHAVSQWQVTATSDNYVSPVFGGSRTASTIAFVAATKKITDGANGLAIFKTGDTIAITGTASNNGLYTVVQGSAAGEIVVSQSLKDEAVGPSVSINSVTTSGLTSLSVPVGTLAENTKYYWHVRYQDSYGNWSAYSPQTSFTTGTTTPAVVAVQQPVNESPFGGATEISPDQKLRASAFLGAAGRTHYASRWQVTSSAGAYGSRLFDSGIDPSNKVQLAMPLGLDYGKTYYWHVKYQDDTGAWSAWSEETSFTIVENVSPSKPNNIEPLDGAEDVALMPVLKASDFSDPDASAYDALTDSHAASQWQVTATAGNYSDNVCVWDSGVASPTTSAIVPAGKLAAGTKYFWHVRYQDNYGNWSGYSAETSFTTKSLSAPVASFSADKTDVTAGMELVTFTDNSTPAGEITAWSWNFGDGATENWTVLNRPSNGEISHKYMEGGTYTVKLTVTNAAATDEEVKDAYVVVHAKPVANILGLSTAKAGKEVTFTDNSTPSQDITSWEWQFDDGTTVQWTATNRPETGQIKHAFQKAGKHTVSLLVKGELGESYYNKQITVTGGGGFQFGLWMIGVALAAVVVVAGVVYLVRARKGK